jgi:DNA-directed RNA polymerase beta' subunit
MPIPSLLVSDYRIATCREVRSWSFGEVRLPRQAHMSFDDHVPGTLHDQRIFGSVHDFQCVCGKLRGEKHKGMICDRCGVKLAPAGNRSSRFGHIELKRSVPHPYATDALLECFPVLPAHYLQSRSGFRLCRAYDQLIEAVAGHQADGLAAAMQEIIRTLEPVMIACTEWSIAAGETLARGMALERRREVSPKAEYCAHCGYLVTGLGVASCPGCGNDLS